MGRVEAICVSVRKAVLVVGRSGPVARGMTGAAQTSVSRQLIPSRAFILDLPGSERRAAAALLSSLPALRSLQTRGTTAA